MVSQMGGWPQCRHREDRGRGCTLAGAQRDPDGWAGAMGGVCNVRNERGKREASRLVGRHAGGDGTAA